jgi:hypothetical protein
MNQSIFRFKNNSPFISGDSIASLCDYVAYGRNKTDRLNLDKIRAAKSIFIPEIPEAEGLDSMITFYNTEKLNAANPYDMDHLDLPALNSWKPRVI